MNCSEFMELLDNYELLDENQRIEMENHCSVCESCKTEYEFFKSIISITSSVPVPKAPETLIADVNAQLDSERTPIIRFKPNFRVFSTVAACLAIGLAVGINNGYIKKNIQPNDTDGVISETVATTTTSPAAEGTKSTPATAPVQIEKNTEEAVVPRENASSTDKPLKSTPVATQNMQTKPSAVPTETVKTEDPQKTPENTPGINDYTIEDSGESEGYAYRRRFSTSRTSHQFSDYLYVKSEDMGAVISTMSELGFVVADGYYMGSRDDFNALMDILSERGIGYECLLQNNVGDNIAFNLQYS